MKFDSGHFFRLQGMVKSVLASSSPEQRTQQGMALANAYTAFREEAQELAASEAVTEEFDRLFRYLAPPQGVDPYQVATFGLDPHASASFANEAFALLSRLSGWLEGFDELARRSMEAEAYAKARMEHQGGSS